MFDNQHVNASKSSYPWRNIQWQRWNSWTLNTIVDVSNSIHCSLLVNFSIKLLATVVLPSPLWLFCICIDLYYICIMHCCNALELLFIINFGTIEVVTDASATVISMSLSQCIGRKVERIPKKVKKHPKVVPKGAA